VGRRGTWARSMTRPSCSLLGPATTPVAWIGVSDQRPSRCRHRSAVDWRSHFAGSRARWQYQRARRRRTLVHSRRQRHPFRSPSTAQLLFIIAFNCSSPKGSAPVTLRRFSSSSTCFRFSIRTRQSACPIPVRPQTTSDENRGMRHNRDRIVESGRACLLPEAPPTPIFAGCRAGRANDTRVPAYGPTLERPQKREQRELPDSAVSRNKVEETCMRLTSDHF
jgi:hypothetical protein